MAWQKTAAAIGWMWAGSLLATRVHDVATYRVLAPAPPAWGCVVLPLPVLGLLLAASILLVVRADRAKGLGWILATYAIPGLDLAPTLFPSVGNTGEREQRRFR